MPPRSLLLQMATDAQGRLVELGEGAFAVVYLGRLQGSPVAVKVGEHNRGWHAPGQCPGIVFNGLARMADGKQHIPPVHVPAWRPPPGALQVIELLPGMDSDIAWREAALLRDCSHERIVPLYGVALKVGEACTACVLS
jgi:hypothetical protein